MNCMKCGREVDGQQVFCEDCLVDMEKYPVPPGIAVHLHLRREAPAPRRQPRRPKMSQEELVRVLRKRVRKLAIALTVMILLFLAALYPAANYFLRDYSLRPGQNYNTVTSLTPTDSHSASAD